MKVKFYLLVFVILIFGSCGLKGYDNFYEIPLDKKISGTYQIQDSSAYANPNFMFSINDDVDRTTCYGALLHIDSLSRKRLYGRFERNWTIQPFEIKLNRSSKHVTVKRKHAGKVYVLLNIYGTSKSRIFMSEQGDLLITKSNYGVGLIVILPLTALTEDFDFVYKKL